jgi:hypothetical protein
MSENIQSISNGSFVLGDTNKLTFSAGNGIQIDQPSEGVVRIGNDETVLWSGTSAGTILTAETTLAESMRNFERIRFYFGSVASHGQVYEQNCPLGSNYYFNFALPGGDANCWMQYAKFSANNDFSKIKMQYCKAVNYGSFGGTGSVTLTATTANDLTNVIKIVGINRISGSNA